MNKKLTMEIPLEERVLRREDIIEVIRYVLKAKRGDGQVDDIDHLGNRRVRSVGELLENQFRIGLARMERAVRERMSIQEIETLMPHDLMNAKPVMAAMKEFFGSSQLSQFMDQTNPLAEMTHKRRLSALGPGGLTRERAGFEVRDVHPTHYGRICPIETPEGPNIGLIVSLSTYARVNDYGFIETPYREVKDGRVTDEIEYPDGRRRGAELLSPRPTRRVDGRGRFVWSGSPPAWAANSNWSRRKMEYMDVSPKQMVGSRRRSFRSLRTTTRTGRSWAPTCSARRCRCSGPRRPWSAPVWSAWPPGTRAPSFRQARRHRGVGRLHPDQLRADPKENAKGRERSIDTYQLIKFQRSNQNTCMNQKPIVRNGRQGEKRTGDRRRAGHRPGRTGAGQNVLVAFMPWSGYNYEDAIIISEKLVKEDATPRSISRSSRSRPETPNSARKRSPATSRTWARRR